MKKFRKIILMMLTVLLIAGTMTVSASAASKVKLNKTKVTLNVKKTYQLKVSGTSKKVTWSTSNKKVATVSSKGKVTAKKKGTATITAKVSGKKYTCKVTVKQPVTSVTLNKKSATLKKKGATVTLKATAKPTSANNRKVSWKSSNTKVATVNSKGKVTAVAGGTATITATAKDGSKKKATCKVTVKIPTANAGTTTVPNRNDDGTTTVNSIALKSAASVSINDGQTSAVSVNLTTKTVNAKGVTIDITTGTLPGDKMTWTSSNNGVATVAHGVITGVKAGTATVTGTYSGMSVMVKVNVSCNHAWKEITEKQTDYSIDQYVQTDKAKSYTTHCLGNGMLFYTGEQATNATRGGMTLYQLDDFCGYAGISTDNIYANLIKKDVLSYIDPKIATADKNSYVIYKKKEKEKGELYLYTDIGTGQPAGWDKTSPGYYGFSVQLNEKFKSEVSGYNSTYTKLNTDGYPGHISDIGVNNESFSACSCGVVFWGDKTRSAHELWQIHATCHAKIGYSTHTERTPLQAGLIKEQDRNKDVPIGRTCTKCGKVEKYE